MVKIGIAGAGLLGRMCALQLAKQATYHVTLFDSDEKQGHQSCGAIAAGMVSPFTELNEAEPHVAIDGLDALNLWPKLIQQLNQPVTIQQTGTLVLAHPQDSEALPFFQTRIANKLKTIQATLSTQNKSIHTIMQPHNRKALSERFPTLPHTFQKGLYFPDEASIVVPELFHALTQTILATSNIIWHDKTPVERLSPYTIHTPDRNPSTHRFDWVLDCRGMGAQTEWPELRGVRGEIMTLETKAVSLPCAVRLLHPRYPLYIVPQPNHRFVIGATQIESEDRSPISARSMMELLSAVYSVHPGFAEARIVHTATNLRPAFPDHQPRVLKVEGLTRLNGFYRHGFLLIGVGLRAISVRKS